MDSKNSDQSRLLLTGANSQIGRCLLQRVDLEYATVIVAGRSPPPDRVGARIRFVEWDLAREISDLSESIDSLVHIAGIWLLPPHLRMLHDAGVRRLVCFSSTSVCVKQDSSNEGERRQAQRTLAAEHAIAEQCDVLGIEWTILRPTLVYGLGIDRNISRATRFVQRFRCYPLAVDALGLRQPVHADDLAAVAMTALCAPEAAGKIYDVGGGERIPYREMIGRIFDVLEISRRFVPLPFLEQFAAAAGVLLRRPEVTGEMVRRMRRDLICDNSAAVADLGYSPRSFLSGGKKDLGDIVSGDVDTPTDA